MINPQKAVQWYKEKYPSLSLNKSDYDIYDELRYKYTDFEYPTDNPFQIKEELNVPTQEELEEKNNPGFFEKVLTANLADAYASDSDWWAEAYNKSIAGTIHQIKYGTPKYDVDEVERAWYDEAGQFFVGLVSPIDVLTFFGSGGIGSIAAKKVATEPLKKMAMSGLSKLAGDSTIKKAAATKFGRYLASSAAIESGVSLGTYGAAGAALQDQAQQSEEIKKGQRTERDYLQTTWAATKHGASSLALGSAAGYVTKGLMAPKFAKAKMSADASFANKVTKLTMNPAGQVIAEGSVFGTGQVAERALMGEDIDMDDFLSSIFMNTAVVGGLRASTKALRIGQNDVTRYKAARTDFYKGIVDPKTGKSVKGLYKDINNNERQSSVAKEIEALKQVEKSFTDINEVPPRDVLDRISGLETQAEVSKIAYDTFEKNLKDYNDLLTEFNVKDIKDLPKEVQVKLLKEAGLVNNVMYEFFTDMQTNRELGYQAYKSEFAKDKPLSDIQKKQIDKMVDNKVAEYKDINEMLNAGALNEPKALNKMKKVFGDGFEVSVKKVKENNFEPVLKTPEGSEVKLASFFKGIKTEKEAKEIASSLNDVYKKVITGEDIAVNKALGIKEKNVEYIPIDAKTGEPQQKMSNLGPKYIKKRGAESEANKLVEQGKAVKPKDIGLEPGIEIANQTSTKNILNEVNEVAGDVTSSLKDKVKADKVEAEKIADAEYKRMSPATAFKTPEKFVNAINRNVRVISKKYDMKYKQFVEFVAREAGVKEPEKFKIKLPKSKDVSELQNFFITLNEFKPGDYLAKKDKIRFMKLQSEVERKSAIDKGLTREYQTKLLKDVIGVEDGNILKASYKQLKEYNDFLANYNDVKKTNVSYTTLAEQDKFIDIANITSLDKVKQEANAIFGTTHSAISRFGFKTLSDKLKTHSSIEDNNIGNSLGMFRANSKKIIGGNPFTRDSRLNKIENKLWSVSNNGEMLLGYMKWKNKDIGRTDKKRIADGEAFFKKAIKKEWWDTVNKENTFGDGLNKKNKDGSYKYLNLQNKEGKIAEQHIINNQDYLGRNKYESTIRQNTNEAELQYVLDKNTVKWVEDGIHISRAFTKDGRRSLALDGKSERKAIIKMAENIAFDEAKRRYGNNISKDMIYKGAEGSTPWEYGLIMAKIKFDNMLKFNPGKITTKYLKERFDLQELYLPNEKGKLKRTYELDFDKTVVPYVGGMSKYYATLEMFPQAIKVKGLSKGVMKDELKALIGKESSRKESARWVEEVVDKQLGLDKSTDVYEYLNKGMESHARLVAKLGLGFPTAGFKNTVMGTVQTLYALRLADVAKGLVDVIRRDSEAYNKFVASNAEGVGKAIYEGGRFDKMVTDKLFALGFMKPTEKFNRLWVIAASKYHQQRQLEKIRSFPKDSKQYKQSYNTLKDFYFLTDKEIVKFEKYGTSKGARSDKMLSDFDKAKMMRDMDVINDKLNTYAHINTQGSSADLFMPKVFGKRAIKPLTLFKRMAYAATDNTQRNVKLSIKNGNIMKPLVGLTATYIGGQAMLSVYWKLLGTPMPKENSDWWQRFKTVLWKGEFLGIMSEYFSPYATGMDNTLYPATWNHLGSLQLHIGQLIEGKSNWKQMGDGIFKSTSSLYGNSMKVINRRNSPFNRDKLRIKKLYSQFEEEVLETPNVTAERSMRSPYYIDLENAFYLGTEEEYAKQLASTYLAVTHDYYRRGYTWNESTKKAKKILKTKFTTMNPNKASLFKSSKEAKMNSLKFIKWLQKHSEGKDLTKRLFEIEAEYKARLAKYNSKVPYYWSKFNIKEMLAGFDWS